LFAEISEGFDALAHARAGKRTLRTHSVKLKAAPKVKRGELAALRKQLDVSRPVFAGYLRTNPAPSRIGNRSAPSRMRRPRC
jgi:putative transcriptional regulator